jgi:hypothetical protein
VQGALFCAAAVVLTLTLSERYSLQYRRNVVDDAATSMQYAKNLALGNGLVFNVGERVEGYSNFLWVLFQAPLYVVSQAFGLSYEPMLIRVSECFATAAVVVLFLVGRKRWNDSALLTALALGSCVFDGSYTTWAVFGLETHFLAFWMLLALLLLEQPGRRRWLWTGLALAAAQLTRPDAGLFCAWVVANELIEAALTPAHLRRSIVRQALAMGGVWLACAAAHLAFRRAYYGDLFPNTYYLKLAGDIDGWARGLAYLRDFCSIRLWLPLLGLFSLLGLRDRVARLLVGYLSCHCLYVVYVGGDFFSGHRFLVPQIPMFALLAGYGCQQAWLLLQRPRVSWLLERVGVPRQAIAGAAAVAIGVAFVSLWTEGRARGPLTQEILAWRDDLSKNRRLMSWLGRAANPGESIATCLIGHTGFFSGLRVIDICGVIDPVIAHEHVPAFGHGKPGHEKLGSPSYILGKQPTYFIAGYLPLDLWQLGYYFSDAVPAEIADGIYTRDTAASTGHYLPETRVSFDTFPEGWTASGDAFARLPAYRNEAGQGDLTGVRGGFVNSFSRERNNDATGRLASPEFELVGDKLEFRLAGGNDPEHLRVSLLLGGRRVASATGRRSDNMVRKQWDVRAYRHQRAVLEIVDDARGPWGYIAVDEIVQWSAN